MNDPDGDGRGMTGAFAARAAEASTLLRLLANENRLHLLCQLVAHGEISVGTLAQAVGLSQSALSQHLAILREHGIVATRRESRTVHYRLADDRALRLLAELHAMFCPPDQMRGAS